MNGSARLYRPNQVLDTAQAGIELIMRFEAFEPNWYLCPAGVWTIGYGTTENSLYGVNRTTVRHPVSREQAETWLRYALATSYEPPVESRVRVPLTQNQFDALVSFVYNVGSSNFTRSTLLVKLNRGDYMGAADELRRWVYAGGQVLRGLVHRRDAERDLFLSEPVRTRPIQTHRADIEPVPHRGPVTIPTKKPDLNLR